MGKYSGKTCRLVSMLSLTATFFLVEITVGYITNSMALVADSFHMLSDVAALLVGLLSVRIARKKTSKNTFGWVRAEVLGALVNAVFLVALCFSIFVESLKRIIEVEEIDNVKLLLVVGGAGLLVNIIGLFLFHSHGHGHHHGHSHNTGISQTAARSVGGVRYLQSMTDDPESEDDTPMEGIPNGRAPKAVAEKGLSTPSLSEIPPKEPKENQKQLASSEQLNMKGVFLHVLGDALGSVIVIISALVIMFAKGDWKFYVDPAMSILMVGIILSTTLPLLKESALILLQTVPEHLEVETMEKKLLAKISGVLAVHEFHVWQLAGNRIIASAHIRCRTLKDYMKIAEQVKDFFHNEGIHSTTIQPEFVEPLSEKASMSDITDCVLECGGGRNLDCLPNTCCGPPKVASKDSPGGVRFRLGNGGSVNSLTHVVSSSPAGPDDSGDKVTADPTTHSGYRLFGRPGPASSTIFIISEYLSSESEAREDSTHF